MSLVSITSSSLVLYADHRHIIPELLFLSDSSFITFKNHGSYVPHDFDDYFRNDDDHDLIILLLY